MKNAKTLTNATNSASRRIKAAVRVSFGTLLT